MPEESNFTLTWVIENYSMCSHKRGETISSPTFRAESLGGSQWYLKLYPKGNNEKNKDYVSCFLHRRENQNSLEKVAIYLNLDISDREGKILKSCRRIYKTVVKDDELGWNNVIKVDTLKKEMSKWNDDSLILRCHMLVRELVKECEVSTKIGFTKSCFQWNVNPEPSHWFERKKFSINKKIIIEVSLFAPKNEIIIHITNLESVLHRFLKCRISLLDIGGIKIEQLSKEDSHRFETNDEVWRFPTFLTKTKLQQNDCGFSNNGKFTLAFEFFVSEGVQSIEVKYFTHSTKNKNDLSISNNTAFTALQNDLLKLFLNKKNADVKLRADNSIFHVHKSLLSARSPVFSAMFDQDKIVNENGIVDIEDLDAETMNSFLEFLYTGIMNEVDYSNSLKIMVAADKYQLLSLVEKCATFLISAITDANVCEILFFSDLVGHKILKDTALDYIVTNATQILLSQSWSEWAKNNTRLATEVIPKLALQSIFAANNSCRR